MSLAKYPMYKDSGIDWIGCVPESWEVKPLKALATINDEALPESTVPDYEIEYVDIGSVSLAAGIERTDTFLFDESPSRARRVVRDGDVLVSTVRTYLKAIAPVVDPLPNLIASTGFAVIRPKAGQCPAFTKYGLQCESFVSQVIARSVGVSYPAINASDLARIPLWAPPLQEQREIAAFLDRETAKIDALIAEQEKLLALLAEKRQATISHAVTRGLDPNAPMKDSGIPWLNQVPAHWEERRVSSVCHFRQGKAHEPFVDDDGEYICVNSRFVSTGGIVRKNCTQNLTPVARNDILMVMSDLPNGRALAKAYFVCDDEPYAVNQRVCALSTFAAEPRFMYYLLDRSPHFLSEDDGMNQTHLSNASFTQMKIFLPPLEEQRAISTKLYVENGKLDVLTQETDRSLGLLKERRAALIAAAVTGKIDVRAAMEAQAA